MVAREGKPETFPIIKWYCSSWF